MTAYTPCTDRCTQGNCFELAVSNLRSSSVGKMHISNAILLALGQITPAHSDIGVLSPAFAGNVLFLIVFTTYSTGYET